MRDDLIARRLRASGIDTIFTLSGGHLFSIYDGCRAEGVRLIDTRHEQTAAFAAEGWSKVTRVPGRRRAHRRPGRHQRDERDGRRAAEPVAAGGARRPGSRAAVGAWARCRRSTMCRSWHRWRGFAATAQSADAVGRADRRRTAGRGGRAVGGGVCRLPDGSRLRRGPRRRRAGALVERPDPRSRPTVTRWMPPPPCWPVRSARSSWPAPTCGGATPRRRCCGLAEQLRIPVLMNGMARGTVPADHELAFSRARSKALGEADVALVIGVPMDFRLGFGGVFGAQTTSSIVADRVEPERAHPRAGRRRPLRRSDDDPHRRCPDPQSSDHEAWIGELRAVETAARAAEQAELTDDRTPLHPMRVYAELAPLLDRDAIVVIDAGDFGSYAGRVIDSYRARRVAGQRTVRLPGLGARLRAGGQAGPARSTGRAAAGRRRVRVQRDGVGHAGSPRRSRWCR